MSNLPEIKKNLMSSGSIQLFKDNLPNAFGDHAEKMAARFTKMVYTTISQSEELQKCSVESLVKAASQAASLDLDIDVRGLAYLVPYNCKKGTKQNPVWVMEAQFQIGYMGLIELAYRSGKVKAISAHCVYESEKDTVKITRLDGQFEVVHPFSFEPPSGKMIAVYASAEIEGIGSQTVVLRIDEIEKLRRVSKAPDSPAWKVHYEAMAKKTAIRQLAKFLPKSIVEDFSRGAAIDEQETFVEAQAVAHDIIESDAGSVPVSNPFDEPQNEADTDNQGQELEPEKMPWE